MNVSQSKETSGVGRDNEGDQRQGTVGEEYRGSKAVIMCLCVLLAIRQWDSFHTYLSFVSMKQCDGRPNDARNKGKLCQVLIESKAMDGFEGGDDICGCVVCVSCLLCILGGGK